MSEPRELRHKTTLEYRCGSGYVHEMEGEWKEVFLSPSSPTLPAKDTCTHCPDCGATVDPDFKPCGGYETT